jgi:hypothetical protein
MNQFLDALEAYIDARIELSQTDEDATTHRTRDARASAEIKVAYARDMMKDALQGVLP